MNSVDRLEEMDADGAPDRVRVVYREVDQDLADGSMSFGPEETVDVDVSEVTDSLICGTTPDGRDIVVHRGHRKEIRTRPSHRDSGAFRRLLGYRQRVECGRVE
jgi:hypothetical protein